jgi:hypothetical protein
VRRILLRMYGGARGIQALRRMPCTFIPCRFDGLEPLCTKACISAAMNREHPDLAMKNTILLFLVVALLVQTL